MSILDKLAKSMTNSNTSRSSSSDSTGYNYFKEVEKTARTWQCRYCSSRHTTYNGDIPKAGICSARGKSKTGMPLGHDWRKL